MKELKWQEGQSIKLAKLKPINKAKVEEGITGVQNKLKKNLAKPATLQKQSRAGDIQKVRSVKIPKFKVQAPEIITQKKKSLILHKKLIKN